MMTKEEAIAYYDSRQWATLSDRERAELQLSEDLLCMPFSLFHKSVEKALGRPVWTHEFANRVRLRKELLGIEPKPSFEDIVSLLPQKKLIVIEH